MMLRRTYLGLEVRREGLRAVAVQRRGKHVALVGGKTLPLAESLIQPGFKRPNVTNPDSFVSALRELMGPLVRGDNRIAVALPDQTGNLFLLDVDTPFKNPSEGAEIVRWQLKDRLPDKAQRFALDYQVLEEKDSGHKRILAAVVARDVLMHYEALIEQAGFAAAVIDFHSLALYNAYRSKIDFGRDFILIGVDGCQLTILVFIQQIPVFYRGRQVEQNPQQVFQELNRSLVNDRQQLPNFNRLPVYLHSDWHGDELITAVDSAFDQDVQTLTSPVSKLMNGHQLDFSGAEANGMAVALGVAERMIQRVA